MKLNMNLNKVTHNTELNLYRLQKHKSWLHKYSLPLLWNLCISARVTSCHQKSEYFDLN